mgnify:CR=1 FL=1
MRKDIDLKHFKQRLEERLKEIGQGHKPNSPVELDQSRMGRLTRMDAMQQQAMTQAASRLVQMEQGRIRTALDRLKSGDYGYCIQCDEEKDVLFGSEIRFSQINSLFFLCYHLILNPDLRMIQVLIGQNCSITMEIYSHILDLQAISRK